jgi:hypothetical protein
MPFALIVLAVLLIVSGARGTYPQLKALLIADFTGQHNFLNWIVALGAVGLLGYVPELQKFSRAFLTLLIVCLFLSEKGFFTKFQQAIASAGTSSTS